MADDGQVKFLAKIDGSNDIQRDLNKIKQNLQNLGKEAKKIDFGKMLSSAVPLNNALQLLIELRTESNLQSHISTSFQLHTKPSVRRKSGWRQRPRTTPTLTVLL